MSYEQLKGLLERCRDRHLETDELVQAIEALANAVEADLLEIKAALGNLALVLEARGGPRPPRAS